MSSDYDPHTSGWYLLPVEVAEVEWYSGLGLTQDQVDVLNSHTLQGLIELVYVRVGNDVLFQGLNGLDTALEATTQTLEVLSAVQELHNAVTASSLGSFSAWFRFAEKYSSQGRYQSDYNSVASAFFGVPIIPDFIFSSDDAVITQGGQSQSYEQFAARLADVRSQLAEQVDVLSKLATPDDLQNENSLYRTSRQVLSDMPPVYAGLADKVAWSDAKLWAMDFYGAYEGQDLAQRHSTDVVVRFFGSRVPKVWEDTSISPGRQIGMGTGFRSGANLTPLNQYASIRIRTAGELMPAQQAGDPVGTMIITFSGRMAIAFNGWENTDGSISSGAPPTMIMINPINDDGEVINPIKGSAAGGIPLGPNEHYIGTFGGVTRGQAQNAGSFQQNITLAMTAAQGLNNTQTEEVRGFLFTFEEYYKSASSVLTSLTQLIQKYAQGIRPA